MSTIDLGIALWSQTATWQEYLDAALLVDRLGYEMLLTNDHLLSEVGPDDQVKYEAWTTLAAWASVTSHSRLGHWVGGNTMRNPAVVAKMAVTVDHASNGRTFLGIGSGWFEREHAAYGLEFGKSAGERLDWLDEAVGIMHSLFHGETVTNDGPHYRVEDLKMYPPPFNGTLPILIGGGGEKKTLRTVARYADMWDISATLSVDVVRHKINVLAEHCAAVGRDIGEIQRIISPTIYIRDEPAEALRVWAEDRRRNGEEPSPDASPWVGPPEAIAERMRPFVDELGITGVIANLPSPYDRETIERLIGEVRPLLASG